MQHEKAERHRISGLLIAGVTALISGVSVFVNSYGVHDFSSPALYTTTKNLVATVVLFVGTLVISLGRSRTPTRLPTARDDESGRALGWRIAGLSYVGIVGGGIAFILFFDGLARTAAAPAAFLHDTLVIFVALIAWPVLSERISTFNLAAIALLVVGEVTIAGGVGHIVLGSGTVLVLGATVLWAVETVIVKGLLVSSTPAKIALTRMGVGAVVLVGYLTMTGHIAELGSLDRAQVGWSLVTGILLAGYVATWFVALERARAIDVTSVLVGSVAITALLQAIAGHSVPAPDYLGVGLVAIGLLLVTLVSLRSRRVAV